MKNDYCVIYEVSIWMQPTPMSCHKYTSIQLMNNVRGLQIEKSNILKRNHISEKDSIRSDFFFVQWFPILVITKDQGSTRKTVTKLNDKGHFSLLSFLHCHPKQTFFSSLILPLTDIVNELLFIEFCCEDDGKSR